VSTSSTVKESLKKLEANKKKQHYYL